MTLRHFFKRPAPQGLESRVNKLVYAIWLASTPIQLIGQAWVLSCWKLLLATSYSIWENVTQLPPKKSQSSQDEPWVIFLKKKTFQNAFPPLQKDPLFSRFTWVMRTEAYRFTCQHAAGFNQLSGRRARVVEAHGASVQAIDQQEGQGCQQQGIVFLHGLRGNEKAPKKKGRWKELVVIFVWEVKRQFFAPEISWIWRVLSSFRSLVFLSYNPF